MLRTNLKREQYMWRLTVGFSLLLRSIRYMATAGFVPMLFYTGIFPYRAVKLDCESLCGLFNNESLDQILIFSQIDLQTVSKDGSR